MSTSCICRLIFFFCAKIGNIVNANFENFIHGIEFTIKFQVRKLLVDLLFITCSNVYREYILLFKI